MVKAGILAAVATVVLTVALAACYAGYLASTDNFHAIVPGEAYRSAQPSAADIDRLVADRGIRTIVNLRGPNSGKAWYVAEREAAARDRITMIDFPLSSRKVLSPERALVLVRLLRTAAKPLLIHCESGADRSGLVSALYLAAVAHRGEEQAEGQLSVAYGHIPLWFLPGFAMDRSWEATEPSLGFGDS